MYRKCSVQLFFKIFLFFFLSIKYLALTLTSLNKCSVDCSGHVFLGLLASSNNNAVVL